MTRYFATGGAVSGNGHSRPHAAKKMSVALRRQRSGFESLSRHQRMGLIGSAWLPLTAGKHGVSTRRRFNMLRIPEPSTSAHRSGEGGPTVARLDTLAESHLEPACWTGGC